MKKKILVTPGPSPVPPEVLSQMATPIMHHRTDEYKAVLKEVFENLKKVFFTQRPVVLFAASGTGAMEAAVSNFVNSASKVCVIEGGKFGTRWTEILKAYGVKDVLTVEVERGKALSKQELEAIIKKNPDIKAVFATLCETSTGTVFDIQGYAQVLKDKDAILAVDAISGLLSDPLYTDDWGVDVVVSGSQKGFMLPPGLAFLSVSEKAEKFLQESDLPKYYFNVKKHIKSLQDFDTPFTSSVSLVLGLRKSLEMILDYGLENMFQKAARLAGAVRSSFKESGFSLLSSSPSAGVTAVCSPVDSGKLVKILRQKYGVSIAGGQESLKGKIFRIAHMGYIDEEELLLALYHLESALVETGYNIEKGKLLSKFTEVAYAGANK